MPDFKSNVPLSKRKKKKKKVMYNFQNAYKNVKVL